MSPQTRGTRPAAARQRSIAVLVLLDGLGTLGQLWRMIWSRRLWWALPVLLTLLIVGGLALLSASPVAPLIYPLF